MTSSSHIIDEWAMRGVTQKDEIALVGDIFSTALLRKKNSLIIQAGGVRVLLTARSDFSNISKREIQFVYGCA